MNKGNGIFVCSIQGSEKFFEANPSAREFSSDSVKGKVQDIVAKMGMTTNRKNPETVNITVESVVTKDGKIARSPYRTLTIQPPIAPLTEAEFKTEWDELMGRLPQEFQSAASCLVHEGHDSKENLLCGLKEFIDQLTPAIEAHADKFVQVIRTVCGFCVCCSWFSFDIQNYSTNGGWSQEAVVRSSNWSLSAEYIDLSTASG